MFLFVRPPDRGDYMTSYSKVEALGIEYNCAVLKKNNIDYKYVDYELFPFDHNRFGLILRENRPSIIGISLSYPQATKHLHGILDVIRRELPSASIIAGGQYASSAHLDILNEYTEIDFIFRFETEPYLASLISALQNKLDFSHIPNLSFRHNGRIINTYSGKRITALDDLPYPDRPNDIIEIIKNNNISVSVLGSRGCWWGQCRYCAIGKSYANKNWVARSPQNIVSEIQEICEQYGLNNFTFVDAEFLGPPKTALARAQEITNLINERQLHITYSINLRPENVTEEILESLRASGLSLVYVGIESMAKSHIHRWNRATSSETIKEAVDVLEKTKVPFKAGFVMFDPLTTLVDLEENINFLIHYPVIEPSLIIRGLELRNGMPLKDELDMLLQTETLYDNYFLHRDTALFVRITRKVFGRILLFMHKLNQLRAKRNLRYEVMRQIEIGTLGFLLKKMQILLELFKTKEVAWIDSNDVTIQTELEEDIDNFVNSELLVFCREENKENAKSELL